MARVSVVRVCVYAWCVCAWCVCSYYYVHQLSWAALAGVLGTASHST